MKDFSFFILKNSLGAKMRRGFRSSCNGDASTSTLNQQLYTDDGRSPHRPHSVLYDFPKVERRKSTTTPPSAPPTLEEMILQLDLEERAAARRAKIDHDVERRMSCVNSNDILRSARNAMLNQYPRFSLDGKDAMYRSSFVCNNNNNNNKNRCGSSVRSRFVGGERVVWCKPGVVARLMGLDAVPVPVSCSRQGRKDNKQNDLYKRMGCGETEVSWPIRGNLRGKNF